MSIVNLKNAFIYQDDFLVLEDVSFNLNEGEFCYLIGDTGSGKSSLLKTMYAELPLKKGEGEVSGHNLNKIKNKNIPFLRRKIGIVFQDFQLLNDRSVKDNLSFVLNSIGYNNEKEILNIINQSLSKVKMLNHINKMPHELSGGEQQKICIARSIINNPKLILADEPTGNLDPNTTKEIMMLLKEISKNGTAILMATHEKNIVKEFPSRMIECKNKKLINHN
ncbi:MAG: phosphonate ABC transporter ATP-binding protein [Flavobacteriales bacterium]|nr:phosphonate ABC transporter ATP-binding protein [Flavobacteriales bacterium]